VGHGSLLDVLEAGSRTAKAVQSVFEEDLCSLWKVPDYFADGHIAGDFVSHNANLRMMMMEQSGCDILHFGNTRRFTFK
jgi:hypothetical protein